MSANDFPQPSLNPLLGFKGTPRQYWAAWTRLCAEQLSAELTLCYFRARSASVTEGWQAMASWPEVDASVELPTLAATVPVPLLTKAVEQGSAVGQAAAGAWTAALIFIRPEAGDREILLCAHVPQRSGAAASSVAVSTALLGQLALLPRLFERERQARQAERDATRFSQTLAALGRVLEAENFQEAALAFVNQVAELFGCEQVSLAWSSGEGLKLRSVSHSDRQTGLLNPTSVFVDLLEEAGQEALLQEREILWPPTDSKADRAVSRAHRQYAEARQPGHLATIPILAGEEGLAALVCERSALAFSQSELWALRLLCDQVARPLRELEKHHRPLPKRLATEIWHSIPPRFRPFTEAGRRFTRWLAVAVLAILLIPLPHRVESTFILKTDAMAFIGAPFDGFIETGEVSLGQTVKSGDTLFTLATREMLLERSAALADIAQYSREVEKRQAINQLAEMRVAEAQQAQAQSKLEQVEYRLAHAKVTSPITGVVVEGEPGKNLGGPVKRGDTVVKVAQVDHLWAEIAVDERDLEQVALQQDVDISLVASPHSTWDLRVTRITPAPTVKEGHNTFPVRAEALNPPPNWWRPGMSGVAKIHVGYRPLIWLATHRLLDYLALALWI